MLAGRVRGSRSSWLGDRCDDLGAAAVLEDALSGLAVVIELPVPRWGRVRGVEDRVVEEWVGHCERRCSIGERIDLNRS